MGTPKSYKKLQIKNKEGMTVRRDKKGKLKKGSILNPEGRTLGSLSLINLLKKKLIEISEKDKKYIYADLVIQKLVDKALEGDTSALRDIFNRIEGMPTQKITGDSENPLIIKFDDSFKK